MTRKERLLATLALEGTDRVALLGCWLLGDSQQQALAGVSAEEYWRDPERYVIAAERALGVDGMLAIHVPQAPGDYRGEITKEDFERHEEKYRSPEDVLAYVRALPSPEDAARHFDAGEWRDQFKADVLSKQAKLGDIVYLPVLWQIVHPKFQWYWQFGYENYLMFMQLYPEEAGRLFESEVEVCRRRAQMAAEVYHELDMIPMTLVGTDTCGRDGPLISPEFLAEYFFPACRRSMEPLHEAGIRTVWHSDGVIDPLVDMLLRQVGVSGFQGFQTEYGVDVGAIAAHTTADGKPLTIFAGLSTAATLRYGTVEQIRHETEMLIDTLRNRCALFILPASNILPDCPVENALEMYHHAADYSTGCSAGNRALESRV